MKILNLILILQILYVATSRELKDAKTFTDQPTKRQAYRETLPQPGNVQEYDRRFDSGFLASEMLENPRKWSMGRDDRPTGL